ncbi:MAG: signal peptide peptidase SppA [Acidobacteria bacterium]|nr:signal peptide peptidase SppA [Acidobacteriota bacterium]
MKKFLLGVAVGLVLAGMSVLILIFALARLGDRRPAVADGSTLLYRLEGPVPEQPPVEIPLPFWESQSPLTVRDNWELLRRAAEDKRIKALVLAPEGVGAGWAKLEELRSGVLEFRKSGKPVIAWLRNPRTREYYLATAADRIYMAPEDVLDVKGLRAELTFFRKTMDKLGVQMEVERIGKYKDAADMFTRGSASEETREVLNSVLDQLFGRLVTVVGASRKRSPEQVRALIDQGPFLAPQAKSGGLVDDLLYEDQVFDELKKRLNQKELKKISQRDYLRASGPAGDKIRRVAYVVGQGSILRGRAEGLGSDDLIASESFIKLLRQVGADAGIKGVVVRVDSPGGDAIASDDILREMKLLSRKKPLVISMSDVAASGGYYIAMTGDPIVAYPDTITGSIGVIFGKMNLRGLYDKIGVQKEILKRGQFADVDSDYQPLTDAGRKKLRESIGSIYQGFLARVAEARKRKPEEIDALGQGRVWMGQQAKQHGLVDELGGLDRAVELLRAKARIPREERIRLVPYPPKRSLLELLLTRSAESALDARLRAFLRDFDLRLWARGGLMRVMPYTIVVE